MSGLCWADTVWCTVWCPANILPERSVRAQLGPSGVAVFKKSFTAWLTFYHSPDLNSLITPLIYDWKPGFIIIIFIKPWSDIISMRFFFNYSLVNLTEILVLISCIKIVLLQTYLLSRWDSHRYNWLIYSTDYILHRVDSGLPVWSFRFMKCVEKVKTANYYRRQQILTCNTANSSTNSRETDLILEITPACRARIGLRPLRFDMKLLDHHHHQRFVIMMKKS